MHSALYAGIVRHRRLAPRVHEFQYRIYMLYLDLAELETAFRRRWLWSGRRFNLAYFRRKDYLGDPRVPLDTAVRDRVEAETGRRPNGPVRVLTQLRTYGYLFNPVTFYYCFDEAGESVEAIVAEITNTPWKERHAYVLPRASGTGGRGLRFRFAKDFHVSPFMPMELGYDWRFTEPGRRLAVHMENEGPDGRMFDATLSLERRPLSGPQLVRVLLTHPLQTLMVPLAIYWQALRLWWKGVPFHKHPSKRRPVLENRTS